MQTSTHTSRATALLSAINNGNVKLPLTHLGALELIALMEGFQNWRALAADHIYADDLKFKAKRLRGMPIGTSRISLEEARSIDIALEEAMKAAVDAKIQAITQFLQRVAPSTVLPSKVVAKELYDAKTKPEWERIIAAAQPWWESIGDLASDLSQKPPSKPGDFHARIFDHLFVATQLHGFPFPGVVTFTDWSKQSVGAIFQLVGEYDKSRDDVARDLAKALRHRVAAVALLDIARTDDLLRCKVISYFSYENISMTQEANFRMAPHGIGRERIMFPPVRLTKPEVQFGAARPTKKREGSGLVVEPY